MVKKRPAVCGLAWTAAPVAAFALASCAGEAFTGSPGAPDKPSRACLAVHEAMPLAMSPADHAACEDTMRGWYADAWYTSPDTADHYTGGVQLDYLRAKALEPTRGWRLPANREGRLDGADALLGHGPKALTAAKALPGYLRDRL